MMKYFIYVALVSVVAMTVMASDAPGSTAEPADSKVIALNAETFDSFLNANKNKPVMIEFYAKWCGFCKKLRPTYTDLASKLSDAILAKIDCEENEAIKDRFEIRGFPTLKLVHDGNVYDYSGDRSSESLTAFITGGYKSVSSSPLPSKEAVAAHGGDDDPTVEPEGSKVVILTADNFEEYMDDKIEVVLIEFMASWCGHCKHLKKHYTPVADRVNPGVNVAKIDAAVAKDVSAQFGIKGFPTIKLLGDDGLVYEYNGGRTTDEMVQFANGGYKTGTGTDYPDPAKAPPPEPEQTTEEPEGSKVVVLNSMGEVDLAIKRGVVLLECYATWCGHCKHLAPKYRELAEDSDLAKAKITIAKIDANTYGDVAKRFGVTGYPTLLLFRNSKLRVYEGAREKDDIKQWLLHGYKETSSIPIPAPSASLNVKKEDPKAWMKEPEGSNVVSITDDNFEEMTSKGVWVIQFYQENSRECKEIASNYTKFARDAISRNIHVAKAYPMDTYDLMQMLHVNQLKLPQVFLRHGDALYELPVRDVAAEDIMPKIKSFAYGGYKSEAPMSIPPRPRSYLTDYDVRSVNKALASNKCLFVQFMAHWCMPCMMSRGTMESVAKNLTETNSPCTVVRVDADKSQDILPKFKIHGYPTFYYIDNGMAYQYNDTFTDASAMLQFIYDKVKRESSPVIFPVSADSLIPLDVEGNGGAYLTIIITAIVALASLAYIIKGRKTITTPAPAVKQSNNKKSRHK